MENDKQEDCIDQSDIIETPGHPKVAVLGGLPKTPKSQVVHLINAVDNSFGRDSLRDRSFNIQLTHYAGALQDIIFESEKYVIEKDRSSFMHGKQQRAKKFRKRDPSAFQNRVAKRRAKKKRK